MDLLLVFVFSSLPFLAALLSLMLLFFVVLLAAMDQDCDSDDGPAAGGPMTLACCFRESRPLCFSTCVLGGFCWVRRVLILDGAIVGLDCCKNPKITVMDGITNAKVLHKKYSPSSNYLIIFPPERVDISSNSEQQQQ